MFNYNLYYKPFKRNFKLGESKFSMNGEKVHILSNLFISNIAGNDLIHYDYNYHQKQLNGFVEKCLRKDFITSSEFDYLLNSKCDRLSYSESNPNFIFLSKNEDSYMYERKESSNDFVKNWFYLPTKKISPCFHLKKEEMEKYIFKHSLDSITISLIKKMNPSMVNLKIDKTIFNFENSELHLKKEGKKYKFEKLIYDFKKE